MKKVVTAIILILSLMTLSSCNNGEKIESYNVEYISELWPYETLIIHRANTNLKFPETPTSTKYTFCGWFMLDGSETGEYGEQLTTSYIVESNLTIYAKWE